MIYLDTSVLLAELLAKDRRPAVELWKEPLVSSRLLVYETWVRLHAGGWADSHGTNAQSLLGRVSPLELLPEVVDRALEPFPTPVRTLDALHLATAHLLRQQDQSVTVATFDGRMARAAQACGFDLQPV